MPKFRKKPVVIEAVHFDGSWTSAQDAFALSTENNIDWTDSNGGALLIATLEGDMIASAGDWIIRGIKGEIYPCKPDIFEATYEPA